MTASLVFGQKKKNTPDVVSNIEAKIIAMKPVGNNSLAKDLEPFYGFAFGGNLMTPVNFGVGMNYNMLFSNVKYGHQNLYGNVGSPKMTVIDAFLTHRENISEDFMVEEMAGFSYFNYTAVFLDIKDKKLKSNGLGFKIGAKALYVLDPLGYQSVFVEGNLRSFSAPVYNENPDIKKYFSRSTLLSLSLGYRFNL
ncbi:hypothetical protein [Kaistella palustris]|uniref:hypothetical protein n=1 Tax=Kaistella palustris TaxID=493376 RepID=UPI0004062277|nr:hypothetical protein [Kaistella palustris]